MIYLFDKDERLIKIIRKPAIKTALQKYSLTKERYVSDRLTVEMKALNDDELEKVEYMAIQTMEDAHTFHYFYVAQKSSDQLTTLIGVQSGIEELRKSPVFDKRPQNALAREVINDLLSGTNWQARFVGETTPHSTNFYYISIFDALKKVCEVWDLEMQFFVEMNGNRIGARYIDFKRKIGQAVGKRVVYGHNALQILQEVERTNIFTALIGRGKGEQVSSAEDSGKQADGFGRKITFEDVVWSTTSGKPANKPKGQKYVELPAMTKLYGIKNADGSMRPKIGFVDFAEEENPEQLLERTYKALVNAARPQLALKTSSVYLRGAKIGDTIRVVRHDKRLDYDTRIFDITFNRLNDQSSDIKLGDRIGESNEAKAQTIADKAIDEFVANEFTNFVKNLPDYLPTADGFNNNWYGAEDPTREHPGKVLINDIWYKPDPEHEGHKIMLRWTGEVWEELLRTFSSEALRAKISDEIEKLNKAMKASDLALKEQTAQALRTAGANASAIEAAKGAITKLNQDLTGAKQTSQAAIDRLKFDFASAQRTANDQTALLKSDLANIRTQQTQAESEIAKQMQALNATKTELAGVKSAQATFEQSTTRRLAELTNVADGKASKSQLEQTAQELKSKIASVQVGGTNLLRNSATLLVGGDWRTGKWQATSGGNGTAQVVPVTSSPSPLIKSMIRVVNNTVGNKDLSQSAMALVVSQKYTVSCYARVASDSPSPTVGLLIRSWANNNDTNRKLHKTISNRDWQRYSFTFTADVVTNSIQFGQSGAGVIEICAPKIESGTLATDYSEAPEDVESQISAVESTFKQRADSLEAGVSSLREGLKTKADSSALNLLSDSIKQSVKSLETDTQNKLDQKLSTAEFDVRAYGIRQEIVNATKDKADRALVTAEAGKLREEFSKILLGNENLFVLKRSSSGYLSGGKNLGPAGVPNEKTSDFIAVTPDEKITFQIWVTVPKGEQAWRAWQFYTKEKELLSTRQAFGYEVVEGKQHVRHLITVPANAAFIRVSARMYADGLVKVERSDVFSDWTPSIEDADGLITEAKATFERTAQGLRTDLAAVQAYVSTDGTRAEALLSHSREETARQLAAERKLIEAGYVAKATYAEDVRGLTRRFEELTVGGANLLAYANFNSEGYYQNGLKRDRNYVYSNLIEIKSTDYILQVWELEPQRKRLWVGLQLFDEQRNPVANGYSTFWFNGYLKRTIKPPQNARYLAISFENLILDKDKAKFKLETGTIPTDWSPAPEDTTAYADTKLAEYKQDIDGQLASVQAALNTANGSLTSFNTWKQSAQETLNKVGRVESGLNETKTSLAEFKRTAEGQLSTITQQIAGKASQTEFQRVQETSKLYERLIGSTESDVVSKVSKMVMSNSLFQVEVSKNEGLKTVQTQLAGSWAVKNLNSAGDLISGLNLGANGVNRLDGRLTHITGQTLIDNAVIKSAMIESMLADKITAGTLNAANVNIINLNANKIVGLDANFIKSKIELAFIEWMRGKTISAQNDAMQINLNDGHVLFYNDDASIKRVLAGYPTQFIRYENKVENGQNHGRTIIGSNRNGTNAWKSVSFAGLVIDNNSNNSVDKIYQFGDYNHMRHAQGDDGWNFSVVTQTMTPGVWNKNSEVWARHFVVPRNTKGDTDSPTQFIRLEESVAAIWNILNHAASGQVTMTQAMKNLINSRKAAWDIVRNVG